MKKLKKIHLIDLPKDDLNLTEKDMSVLLGGNFDNCSTYNLCGEAGRNSCTSYDTTACSGGGANDMRCSTYSF